MSENYMRYLAAVSAYQSLNKSQRFGQSAFNVLAVQYPEHAKKVRGTDLDPFYHDVRTQALFEYLSTAL